MAATLKFLRTLHSWLGLIALPWVILFGFTGFYLNHGQAIRSVLPLVSYEDVGDRFATLPSPPDRGASVRHRTAILAGQPDDERERGRLSRP
ncbi:hypothetical protein SAMN05421850_11425 [Lutimaribacter saemankumensis]|uniref:PepSY-associated TM region n=1 Tax=Lutimaribacter saemankumensis TaxID=490829 RepID=A0A1G8SXA0_9RHOB|nr:hypothetical protein SAMN05421850_11425 [Lutimaribacter saemankumensis]